MRLRKRSTPQKNPPTGIVAVFTLSTAGLALYTAMSAHTLSPAVSGLIYAAAGLSLMLFIWLLANHWQLLAAIPRRLAKKTVITQQWLENAAFRATVSTYSGLLFNSIAALTKSWASMQHFSSWFGVLAGYYLLISIARFLLLRSERQAKKIPNSAQQKRYEWHTYRRSGGLLLATACILQLTVYHIVKDGARYTYHGNLIYAVAFYDFYSLTKSIIYMIRTRKSHTPIIQAMKTFSFVTSLVAMLSLQTAMFASFGTSNEDTLQQVMNSVTGTGICLLVAIIGGNMVRTSSKKIDRLSFPTDSASQLYCSEKKRAL